MHKKMVTSSKLARLLGVHKNTINRLAREGQIPHLRLPSGHRRFDYETVLVWLEASELEKLKPSNNVNAE